MKRFPIALVLLGACASAAVAQPKDAAPPRPAPIPRAAAPAPPRAAAPRTGAAPTSSFTRPPAFAAPYARDRNYGQGQPQAIPQGGYARAPQAGRTGPNAGDARGGYDPRNSGARSGGYQNRPYDNRTFGGSSARGYGYAQRFQPRFAPYRYPRGYGYRAFHRGDGFPRALLISDYILFDYAAFNLPPPPRSTYEWVRYGPDAVLVDTYSGQIVDVDYGVFATPPDGYADPGGDYPPEYAGAAPYPPQGDRYDAPAYPYAGAAGDPRDGAYPPNDD